MKDVVFNASITVVALVAGVCSFVTMPDGHALNEQEKIVSRGLATACRACYDNGGCKKAQKIPTLPPTTDDDVTICDGTPSRAIDPERNNTREVTHASKAVDCEGDVYSYTVDDKGKPGWRLIGTNAECGTWSECNDQEGGWGTGKKGERIDGRANYKKECEDEEKRGE
jgi:hypothetical protein